ncbi:hypothetical protein AVO42_00235 [Thiomicrospira sp. XS5]|uniref:TonB-dependent receptor plug domain-containing protein n=1 Tax=Thiomicrospira sp. XS5 TaxID=1775636 RepID=UPI000747ECF6|nr:TonB-dependent receptor [Thiomicrospira sp. XS5]KUJ73886.1 hypothetical protein AVO42_00235 [Thiomicrospira sp. XS5]
MTYKKNIQLTVAIAALLAQPAWADPQQNDSDDQVFTLGKIQVSAQAEASNPVNVVMPDDIRQHGQTDVGEAVKNVPGVVLVQGGRRAESQANIRGFDSRQITLNLDGMPIYVPYDGNIDLSRYLTADLSRIEVSKSLGSLLEGPNNMGGSINLVTRRPTRPLEVEADMGVEAGKDGLFKNAQSIQVSSGGGKMYLVGGLSRLEASDYPLSDDYHPTEYQPGDVVQGKGSRDRSGTNSTTGNLKLGYMPNATDEYTLSYYQTQSDKQSPPYAGSSDTGQKVRYWDWPQWNQESVYYVGHTQVGAGYVKSRLFYDQFNNKLNSYDDDRYQTVTKGYAFRSQYDDQTMGGSLEGGMPVANHDLKASLQVKYDEHRERDLPKDNSPSTFDDSWRTYQSHIYSLGLEDTIALSERTNLTLGYRRDEFEMTKTDDGDPNNDPDGTQGKDNFQIKGDYTLQGQTLFAGVSLKSRFPTMKEMFSYRLGSSLPNMDLKAEQATHYEIGAKGRLSRVNYQANVFYSDITDAIEYVTIQSTECGGTICNQNQNVGTGTSKGVELQLDMPVTDTVDVGAAYAYVDRELSDKDLVATYSPKNKVSLYGDWYPAPKWQLGVDWHYQDGVESSSDGSRPTAGFNLWNLSAAYDINKHFSTNVVLKNALDTDYEISEGDPMPGRTVWVNLHASY